MKFLENKVSTVPIGMESSGSQTANLGHPVRRRRRRKRRRDFRLLSRKRLPLSLYQHRLVVGIAGISAIGCFSSDLSLERGDRERVSIYPLLFGFLTTAYVVSMCRYSDPKATSSRFQQILPRVFEAKSDDDLILVRRGMEKDEEDLPDIDNVDLPDCEKFENL